MSDSSAPDLPASWIKKLLEASGLDLAQSANDALKHDLNAIGLWYLMPIGQRFADADIDATRRYLRDLHRHSKAINPPLRHALALLGIRISQHLEQMPEWTEGGYEFDLEMIRQFVALLPEVSKRLSDDVEVPGRGRRANFTLDHSVKLAAEAFARAGIEVAARGPSATQPEARLAGGGAPLFADYFRKLDRHLSDATLARALIRGRKRERQSRT